MKTIAQILLAAGAFILFPWSALAFADPFASVSVTSVSGDRGHAFVYAQVTDSRSTVPAPNGTSYQSPYYSIWQYFQLGGTCPYLWAVYVYDKATNTQINPVSPVSAPSPNFHTTTLICPTPSSTPVGAPRLDLARARLDLDLSVVLTPAQPVPGATTTLTATLSSALTSDLGLYLSMAIQDWTVDRWDANFGDGQSQIRSDQHGSQLRLTHVYPAPGSFEPRVTAFISGHAQAAAYDGFGSPFLTSRTFTVEVSNTTRAQLGRTPVVAYVPPVVVGAVTPVLAGSSVTPGLPAFVHVEALRGTLTDFYVRAQVVREAYLTRDGVRGGGARTTLTQWRFTGAAPDAAAGTAPNTTHGPRDPLRLQWNSPGPLVGGRAQDYQVPLVLVVRSVYADGHVETFSIPTHFTVTVDFPAQNG